MESSALELLSRAALNVQEHEGESHTRHDTLRKFQLSISPSAAALELSKLPAKKKLLSQLKQQQQNAIQNQAPPTQSSIPIVPVNQAHSTTNFINSNNKNPEPMEQDDDEDINVHDDDSPLDMRITKHDSDSDSVRPSVIRRAPSFKETSNSPSGKPIASPRDESTAISLLDPTSTCDPFIDEHFRRSLGTDYDLIIRNKLEQEQVALQKQRMIEEQMILQQQQAAQANALQASQQKLKHHKKHQIHQHHQAMLAAKQAIATPPTTPSPPSSAQLPMSMPTPPSQHSPGPVVASAPVPPKKYVITEQNDANEMSVDDHFAKALGDTWKQFQSDGK